MGTLEVAESVRSSKAEWFVRTIKESCLERMILFGESWGGGFWQYPGLDSFLHVTIPGYQVPFINAAKRWVEPVPEHP